MRIPYNKRLWRYGFSRPQVLFIICLAVVAFEIGNRMAKKPPAPVRKTTITTTNVVVSPTLNVVTNVWPTQTEPLPPGYSDLSTQPVTNNRVAVQPIKKPSTGRQS